MAHERIIVVEEILMILAINNTVDISIYVNVYVFDDTHCLYI
jgi:hypothetical protein